MMNKITTSLMDIVNKIKRFFTSEQLTEQEVTLK